VAAVFFDLDGTLLDSSALRLARDEKRWEEVLARMGEVRTFASNPHDLPAQLRAQGVSVGVVTSSPRPYAEALLSRFDIAVDVLVSGSDRYAPKPDPAALIAACEELHIAPSEAAYVGDQITDFQAAAAAGMMAVGGFWSAADGRYPTEWVRHWPDIVVSNPSTLIEGTPWSRLGPVAEVILEEGTPRLHAGSVIVAGQAIYGLGRYFTRSDSRCESHRLSLAIVANKATHVDSTELSDSLVRFATALQLEAAIVTSVPGPADDPFDRFGPHRASLATALGGEDRADLLNQVGPAPNYKHLHGAAERDAANIGRFVATQGLDGEAVVLLDDVLTSGSTIRACQAALLDSGASSVVSLVLAVAQESLPTTCPGCHGGILQYKERSRDGRPFWACSRWCGYIRDVAPDR
jgi:HAD superfamily hydrolase (TIGR01549 family)